MMWGVLKTNAFLFECHFILLQGRLQAVHEKWCKSKTKRAEHLNNLHLILKLVEKLLQYKDGLHCVCAEDVSKVGNLLLGLCFEM